MPVNGMNSSCTFSPYLAASWQAAANPSTASASLQIPPAGATALTVVAPNSAAIVKISAG